MFFSRKNLYEMVDLEGDLEGDLVKEKLAAKVIDKGKDVKPSYCIIAKDRREE